MAPPPQLSRKGPEERRQLSSTATLSDNVTSHENGGGGPWESSRNGTPLPAARRKTERDFFTDCLPVGSLIRFRTAGYIVKERGFKPGQQWRIMGRDTSTTQMLLQNVKTGQRSRRHGRVGVKTSAGLFQGTSGP